MAAEKPEAKQGEDFFDSIGQLRRVATFARKIFAETCRRTRRVPKLSQ
jgi:hypothetical protein